MISRRTSEDKRKSAKQQHLDLQVEDVDQGPSELQPMPFKDFRLVLRANMQVPCSFSKDCPFKFQDVGKMEMHSTCHKDSSFACSECGLELPQAHQLDVDFLQCPALDCKYKSPVSALVCETCSRKFVNGKTLSKHVKTVHNKIKPFICNVCGKKTACKASLIIHMRQHTGEKALQCGECKFPTRDPSVLHKHRQRHGRQARQSSTLKCSQCDYYCIQHCQ